MVTQLNITDYPRKAISNMWLTLASDGLGEPIRIPIIVVRGKQDAPVVGITSAVHGNELNGIPVIHKLIASVDPAKLNGTLVCVPVVNVPAYKRHRRFIGRDDLNHIMPGDPHGNINEVYVHRLIERIITQFDYLIDLHTASFGRVNSLYVRADMDNEMTRTMAILQHPDIILHNLPGDNTLRGIAMGLGIPAITVEVGDPHVFQPMHIRPTLHGIRRVLTHLGLLSGKRSHTRSREPIICRGSQWIFTDHGGLLKVIPDLTAIVEAGERIATLIDIFGAPIDHYNAPTRAVVIGKSTNPVAQTGARIVHLGTIV